MTEAKASLFREYGFNRVSFGVQTLNTKVLDGVNRDYQSQQQVAEAFRILHKHRYWINVDLIRGLPGESEDSMDASLASMLALEPTQITMYAISPYTPIEVDSARLGPIADAAERYRPIALEHGYTLNPGATCLGFTLEGEGGVGNLLADERREQQAEVIGLVERLPDNQREVVRLKFQSGLSYREIADVTQLSVSNVGFLLHGAMKKLRQMAAALPQ